MGYRYSWDFSSRDGLQWHEILDENGKLVFQVQMNIPLERIVKDLCTIEDIELDYFIASDSQATYDKFCQRVRDFEAKK
jgi:hypothetical protein